VNGNSNRVPGKAFWSQQTGIALKNVLKQQLFLGCWTYMSKSNKMLT